MSRHRGGEIKAELKALWSALQKLAASLLWRTSSELGADAAATSAATSAACTERLPERTMEQIEEIPVPQASASQVIGSLPRLDESAAPVYHEVRQEQIAAGETTRNIVENSTLQEQVTFQENPEVQVMERIQARIVETIEEVAQECVQQRIVGQIVLVPLPQVQEQVIGQEIPGVQVVERIQEQIAELGALPSVPRNFLIRLRH